MSKFYTLFTYLLFLTLLVSCTRNDAQREFEQEAFSAPSNFTETTSQNEVILVDKDDWRTSPLFQGLVTVIPPYPNPTTTDQLVQFHVDVTGVQSVSGLDVLVRLDDGTLRHLYDNFETLHTGYNDFRIDPIEFALNYNAEGARGLHRVYIYDGNQRMISYGDIMVE
ncbi:MAG: hypothetical protein WD022_05560 [Balneolaceae bacterium]